MDKNINEKHAYLVMAHTNFDQLKLLLELLDHRCNDIYLHIDKKALKNFNANEIQLKYSELFLVDSIRVAWGGHSQIECEMLLFRNAATKHYKYYHLISGADLPLKTQDYIHNFFNDNFGLNFIEIDENAINVSNYFERTQYFYLFQNIIGRSMNPFFRAIRALQKITICLQKLFHIKRKNSLPLYKGANWVSITDDLVQYLLSCEKLVQKQFCFSFCADELFLQSIAMSSPYRDTIVRNCYREIDWERGKPYQYRKEDISLLQNSKALFARKFNRSLDSEIIDMVIEHVKRQEILEKN